MEYDCPEDESHDVSEYNQQGSKTVAATQLCARSGMIISSGGDGQIIRCPSVQGHHLEGRRSCLSGRCCLPERTHDICTRVNNIKYVTGLIRCS